MKILQTPRKYFAEFGIDSIQANQKNPYNERNLLVCLIYGVGLTSSFIYMFHMAKVFDEYIDSVFMSSTIIIDALIFITHVWKMTDLFQYITNLETIITSSE